MGIQEKTAFVVQGKGIAGGALYKPIVSIPATIELLLVRLPCSSTVSIGTLAKVLGA